MTRLLRYFQSVYVQYTSFKCLADASSDLFLTLLTSRGENFPIFKADEWSVLDVRWLRITQKMGKFSLFEACCPCTLMLWLLLWQFPALYIPSTDLTSWIFHPDVFPISGKGWYLFWTTVHCRWLSSRISCRLPRLFSSLSSLRNGNFYFRFLRYFPGFFRMSAYKRMVLSIPLMEFPGTYGFP